MRVRPAGRRARPGPGRRRLGRPRRPGRPHGAGRGHPGVPGRSGEPRVGGDTGGAGPAAGGPVPHPGRRVRRRRGRGRRTRRRADAAGRRAAPPQPAGLGRHRRAARRERAVPPGQGPGRRRDGGAGGPGRVAAGSAAVVHRPARAAGAPPGARPGAGSRADDRPVRAAGARRQRTRADRPGRAGSRPRRRRPDGGRAGQRPAAAGPVRRRVPALGRRRVLGRRADRPRPGDRPAGAGPGRRRTDGPGAGRLRRLAGVLRQPGRPDRRPGRRGRRVLRRRRRRRAGRRRPDRPAGELAGRHRRLRRPGRRAGPGAGRHRLLRGRDGGVRAGRPAPGLPRRRGGARAARLRRRGEGTPARPPRLDPGAPGRAAGRGTAVRDAGPGHRRRADRAVGPLAGRERRAGLLDVAGSAVRPAGRRVRRGDRPGRRRRVGRLPQPGAVGAGRGEPGRDAAGQECPQRRERVPDRGGGPAAAGARRHPALAQLRLPARADHGRRRRRGVAVDPGAGLVPAPDGPVVPDRVPLPVQPEVRAGVGAALLRRAVAGGHAPSGDRDGTGGGLRGEPGTASVAPEADRYAGSRLGAGSGRSAARPARRPAPPGWW